MYLKQTKPRYTVQHKIRFYFTIIMFSLALFGVVFIYYFDKVIAPTVLMVADGEMRTKTVDIINKNILEVYGSGSEFNYQEIVTIQKDENGKINNINTDTMMLNKLATELAIKSQKEIKEVGSVGVKMPIGYVTKNNILSYFGPTITVKMEPIGRVDTSYESTFESAGINQTIHKIYINFTTNIKVILPLQSREVEVKHQIPISENIIVGEVPRTMLGSDLLRNNLSEKKDNNLEEKDNIKKEESKNPLEEAGDISLPDIPELGTEFKR